MPTRTGTGWQWQIKRLGFPWRTCNLAITLLVLSPLVALLWLGLVETSHAHLAWQGLGLYLTNTLLLLLGVGAVTISIGVICAWLVVHFRFPLCRLLSWALLLPLALPGYIAAYIYTTLLDYPGQVQSLVRMLFGFTSPRDYWFPQIRSLSGAIVVMSLVLYPYVYMLLRTTLLEQSGELHQAARSLGMSRRRIAWKIYLPLARPALIAGAALAMLEAVSDFGTVDYFAVPTLLTGMYDLWLTMGDIGSAARLALLLTTTTLLVLGMERYSRRQRRYFYAGAQLGNELTASETTRHQRKQLHGWRAALACLLCCLPVAFGFVIPVTQLGLHAISYFAESFRSELVELAWNSLRLALATMLCALIGGLLVVYTQRWRRGTLYGYTRVLCSLGYATPGAVLAIGIIVVFTGLDKSIDRLAHVLGGDTGLIFSGSLLALVCALSIRFLSISAGALESSLGTITPNTDLAARSLGHSTLGLVRRYHLPLLRRGLLIAALIIFVDSMKELPATLILRPFDFNTLATHIYFLAGDERIEQAALGGLLLVVPSTLAMLWIHRLGAR